MKVFDKRADEILEKLEIEGCPRIACAINRTLNAVKDCRIINCDECNKKMFKLLMEEYKESIKLSRLEYEVLKWLKDKNYRYIARDSEGVDVDIEESVPYIYAKKPIKDMTLKSWKSGGELQSLRLFRELFQFIKWEDEEPTLIEDILNNCEIVEDEEKC